MRCLPKGPFGPAGWAGFDCGHGPIAPLRPCFRLLAIPNLRFLHVSLSKSASNVHSGMKKRLAGVPSAAFSSILPPESVPVGRRRGWRRGRWMGRRGWRRQQTPAVAVAMVAVDASAGHGPFRRKADALSGDSFAYRRAHCPSSVHRASRRRAGDCQSRESGNIFDLVHGFVPFFFDVAVCRLSDRPAAWSGPPAVFPACPFVRRSRLHCGGDHP